MITRQRTKIDIAWKEREMSRELAPRIVVDAKIRFGKPVIQGTRVPVDLLVGKVGGGMSPEEVAEEYGVTVEDVRAALLYAASVVAAEEVRETA
jgi:uncharacterized protein (DUF433 family)